MRRKRFVSSTNIIGFKELDTLNKSLTYIMNNSGAYHGTLWDTTFHVLKTGFNSPFLNKLFSI